MEPVKRFEAALADFRARKFGDATTAFRVLGDAASRVYIELCERYRQEPPPADWDGSYQMEHK
jgi:adenylate cyclase